MEKNHWNCSHKIHPSKFERNAPEIQNWWYKLFDIMEKEASIPPHKKIDVLSDIFPKKILEKIFTILNMQDGLQFLKTKTPTHVDAQLARIASQVSIESVYTNQSDKTNRNEIGPNNPYLKFFKRRADRAAIWHTLPPLSLEEMDLTQKAEAITEKIATEFVEWLVDKSEGNWTVSLTVGKVLKLFEIGFNTHAAQSLQVRIRELLTIPTGVAILNQMPELEKRNQLRMLIEKDVEASTKQERIFAFGSKLAPEEQVIPPKKSEVSKWMVCSRVPTKLRTMAVVFQGITHLKSTRMFCEYLLKNPNIKRPEYLVQANMFDIAHLKKSEHALELEKENEEMSDAESEQLEDQDDLSIKLF